MTFRWMIATNNEGKLLEFEKFFEGRVVLESFKSFGKKSPEEPYKTFLENALEKARYASLVSKLPSIADDSGLVVDFLRGLPGVRSARFATVSSEEESDALENRFFLARVISFPEPEEPLGKDAPDGQPLSLQNRPAQSV